MPLLRQISEQGRVPDIFEPDQILGRRSIATPHLSLQEAIDVDRQSLTTEDLQKVEKNICIDAIQYLWHPKRLLSPY